MRNLRIQMGRIISLTLLADIGSCLTILIYFWLADSFGMGFYVGLLTFGNILIPTLAGVLIYLLLKRWVVIASPILKIMIQILLLIAIFIFGLYVWAAIDSFLFETLTWENIKNDYDSQFAGFLPVVLTEAILIPNIDFFLTKRQNKKHAYNTM